MVSIRVREDYGVDVSEGEAETGNLGDEVRAEPRQASVDGGQTTALLNRVPVEQRIPEPVDTRGDFNGRRDVPILVDERETTPA